jgi:hypothetical protein
MTARILSRSALGVATALAMLTACGGGNSTSAGPSLPIAAQFSLTFVNSVVYGPVKSSISFELTDSTKKCINFAEPFSDNHLNYNDSAERTIMLLDCGTAGSFTVKFHALDVPLADMIVKWTVSEPGLNESIVQQGGLCIKDIGGLESQERIIAKPPGGCPAN